MCAYVFDKQEFIMKFVKIAVLSAAVLSLGACACQPRHDAYYKTPYGYERTAGEGSAVYDGKCRQPAEPARKAEEVFDPVMRK